MSYESAPTLKLQLDSLKYAKELRSLQAEVANATRNALSVRFDANETPEQQSTHRQEQMDEYHRLHESYTHRFRSEFRTDGVLLYEELLRRTGEKKVYLVPLDSGMLAGASPLEEVAHEIEKLARKLSIRPN